MAASGAGESAPGRAWPDWLAALVLVVVAAALHAWMIARTEVMARDTIGFVRQALLIEEQPWSRALANSWQHPGFAAYLLAVSWPVRALLGTTPDALMLSAQIANALAATLLLVPLYYLGRELLRPFEAFAAALLFLVLPVSLQVTSDGLSEGLYLLMAVSALWMSAQGLRTRSAWRFAAAGLLGGLAYLTRPEGALTVLAAGGVLLGMQAVPACRWPWRTLARSLGCLGIAALIGASPYLLATGSITRKPTPHLMIHGEHRTQDTPGPQLRHDRPRDAEQAAPGLPRRPLLACVLAVWWEDPESSPPAAWALWAVISETGRTLQYILIAPFLVGLVLVRHWRALPQAWLLLVLAVANGLILVWLAGSLGYVSERHTLLMVLCCVLVATRGLMQLADWLAGWARWRRPDRAQLAALAACVLLLAPMALKPLHANRAGHRAAGHWLAEHAQPYDVITDPICWAHYFAGHTLLEGKKPAPPPGCAPTHYVVIERGTNRHPRLDQYPVAQELARQGTRVFRWEPSGRHRRKAEIVEVYAVPLADLAGPPASPSSPTPPLLSDVADIPQNP